MKWVCLLVIALVAACSGSDSEDSFTLSGGTYTEDEFRTEMRAFLLNTDAEAFCQQLTDLSGREIADALIAFNRGTTPIQSPNPDDEARAGEIVKEECGRID